MRVLNREDLLGQSYLTHGQSYQHSTISWKLPQNQENGTQKLERNDGTQATKNLKERYDWILGPLQKHQTSLKRKIALSSLRKISAREQAFLPQQ